MNECPYCGKELIKSHGNREGDLFIIGGMPSDQDIETGLALVDQSLDVLRREFHSNKIDVKRFRFMLLWRHPPMKPASKKKEDKLAASNQNEKCFNHFLKLLMEETGNAKAVLLTGAESTKALTDKKVSEWSGLHMTSDYINAPLIMCVPKPSMVFGSPPGEVKLTIRKFSKALRKGGYYNL